MKQNPQTKKLIEKASHSLSQITLDTGALLHMIESGPPNGVRRKLLQLQVKVDQLRKDVWLAQRSTTAGVVELSPRRPEDASGSSLVDRVFTIFDRCG
ncbi:MAG TPA: hypothetical protein VG892_11290 [Terriglobales bacterium]|nr:hypothetical protein [Terriglobales bacterium]